MRTRAITSILGSAIILASASAYGAEESLGAKEYAENCAVCHGSAGKGDGPLTEHLKGPLPNLRLLAKNNNGVFPFDNVYQMIDGRTDVKAHGPRDMPVWGNRYNRRAVTHYRDYYGRYDAESFVQGRILALIVHIHGMQDK